MALSIYQQYKAGTMSAAEKNKLMAQKNGGNPSAFTTPTPTASNPVISTSVKPPAQSLPAPQLGGGYAATAQKPNENYYDSAQYKGDEQPKVQNLGPTSFAAAREYENVNQVQNGGQMQEKPKPAGQLYSDAQLASRRGTLWEDLRNEGFSEDEILKLGNSSNINSALGNLSGIKGTSRNGDGNYVEDWDQMSNYNFQELLMKARADKKIGKIGEELKTREGQIKSDLTDLYKPEFTKARESADRAKETDLRLAGRSAFGTATAERQDELNTKQQEIERSIAAQQRLEEQQQVALARGASQEEINGINTQIQSFSEGRAKIQAELELQTAGMEEAAVAATSDMEKQVIKDSLEAAKSGLIWDNSQGTYIKDPNAPPNPEEFDFELQTDNTGNVTQVRTNKVTGEVTMSPLGTIGKGDLNGGAKYQHSFNPLTGDEVVFDPTTGNSWPVGGSDFGEDVAFFSPEQDWSAEPDPETGQPADNSVFSESTPTSNSSGVKVVGDPKGLGGNCVLYARSKNPALPYGLYDKQDKINAIAKAGSKDWSKLKIGDTILSGEGDVGHAFQVMGFNKATNKIIIDEANYTAGKVTQGREISITDPKLYGYVPNKTVQGPPVQVSNNANEGQNKPITTQVENASGKAMQASILAMAWAAGIDINDKSKAAMVLKNAQRGIFPTESPEMKQKRLDSQNDAQWKNMDMQWKMDDRNIKMDDSNFQRANTLRTDFDSQTAVKDFKTVQTTANEFKKIINSGVQGPADVSLVFKFMKALDPSSVVRETEFDQAANSSGQFTAGTVWSKFNGKFKNGRFLSDAVRNDFLKLVEQSVASKKQAYDQEMNRYSQLGQNYGVDPNQIVFDYNQSSPAPQVNNAPKPSGGGGGNKLSTKEIQRFAALTKKAAQNKTLPAAEYKEWKALMAKNSGNSGGGSIPSFSR